MVHNRAIFVLQLKGEIAQESRKTKQAKNLNASTIVHAYNSTLM